QTQTSNTLHNAIMEAGGKDRLSMLAPGIDNDIYSTVDACPNACEMWKAIERFYKLMNELVKNQCDVTNHQVNVQFLLQLQPEWQRFVTLVKQSQELKIVSYHKLYDILKQHRNEINKLRAERIAPIVNSPQPIYDEEPSMVAEDNEMSKDKEIDKLMALISLSFKKIYKPTNNNLRTSSNTSRANHDKSLRINRGAEYDNQSLGHVDGARKTVETKKDKGCNLSQGKDAIIEHIDRNVDDDDLANERELLASLIEKLKCKINDSKNRNKFLETSNKVFVEKLKGDIEDFKNKNKSLETSNNRFKKANNKLSETNALMYNDLKKFQAELDKRNDVKYASKVEIDCAKSKRDLISYKMESQKSFNKYTQHINDLNQTILGMKNELSAHQETISILSQAKEAQIKCYKTHEDKELDKVIALENKVKVLDNIVYKTGQSVQTMNMLNRNCKTSFAKPEYLKKAQKVNPRLLSQISTRNSKTQFLNEIDRLSREYYYDDHMNAILGVYTELDEVTNLQCDYLEMLEKYECLEKELSKNKMMSKFFEALQKHAINLEINLQQCQEKIKNNKSFKENQSKEFRTEREQYFEIQELKAQLQDKDIAISELKKLIEKLKGKSVDTKFEKSSVIRQPNAFKSQRPSILGKPTIFSDSIERKDFSKSKSVTQNNESNDFSKPATAQILPPNKKSILKNMSVLAPGMYKLHTKPTQTRTSQLPNGFRKTNKRVSFSTGVIPTTSVSRPKLKSNLIEDRVLLNNSQGKKQEVEDHHRNVKFSKNKTSVTACDNVTIYGCKIMEKWDNNGTYDTPNLKLVNQADDFMGDVAELADEDYSNKVFGLYEWRI
nr:hypothetical protein [Tanacetum cinerariifolium]